jgi:hypothetical protein
MDAEKLLEKGWPKEAALKTARILAKAEEAKPDGIRTLDKVVHWVALLIIVLGTFVVSILLVPLLLVASGPALAGLLVGVGVGFGLLFEVVVSKLERLEHRPPIVAGLFIPVLALINVYVITSLTNRLAALAKLESGIHDPILVSIVYVAAFSLPFMLHKLHLLRRNATPSA